MLNSGKRHTERGVGAGLGLKGGDKYVSEIVIGELG